MGLFKSPTNAGSSAQGLGLGGEDMGGTPPAMQSLLGEIARDGGGSGGQPFSDYQQQQMFGGNQQVSWWLGAAGLQVGALIYPLPPSYARTITHPEALGTTAGGVRYRPTTTGSSVPSHRA